MKRRSNPNKYQMKEAVEIHSSLWLEDMRKLKVSDFKKGGVMTIDPYILNGSEEILLNLTKKFWNIIYVTRDFVDRGYYASGFMYLIDTENGLDIFHSEPVRKSESVNKPINLERAML